MLHVVGHHSLEDLTRVAKVEKRAKPRLRLQAVILALQGQNAASIAQALGTTERSAYSWLARYNRDGLAALLDAPRPGRPLRLTPEQLELFRARLEGGPRPEDGVCSLRGVDLQRILAQEFGVTYSLNGVYWLLHHLGYSYLMPVLCIAKRMLTLRRSLKKEPRPPGRVEAALPANGPAASGLV